MTTTPLPSPSSPAGSPTEISRLQELAVRAQAGDTSVLPELRSLLQNFPTVWRCAGDLAVRVEEVYLRLLSDDLFTLECVRRCLVELKAELAPKTPLERLLVDRIGLSFLQCHTADVQAAKPAASGPADDQRRKRVDSAHKRYLQSLQTLASVRRLLGRVVSSPPVRSEANSCSG